MKKNITLKHICNDFTDHHEIIKKTWYGKKKLLHKIDFDWPTSYRLYIKEKYNIEIPEFIEVDGVKYKFQVGTFGSAHKNEAGTWSYEEKRQAFYSNNWWNYYDDKAIKLYFTELVSHDHPCDDTQLLVDAILLMYNNHIKTTLT